MNKNQIQQGDVNLEKLSIKFFSEIKNKKLCDNKNGWILAHGESGHIHKIENVKKAEMYEYYDDYLKEKCLLLKVLENQTELQHEEHQSIILDRGIYRVNKINEYDPFEKFTKKVVD